MNVHRLLATVLCVAVASAAVSAQTTIYVVRHAEKKADPGNRNPPLSELGLKRAAILAKVLRSVPLDTVYATKFERTRKTVEPAAEAAKLKVTEYASERVLADVLKSGKAGTCVLVAGHSNTVPELLAALGVQEKVELGDAEYDNLFIVVIGKGGDVTYQHLHYGVGLGP